jgi:tRNA(Ile)-lysidine synthase
VSAPSLAEPAAAAGRVLRAALPSRAHVLLAVSGGSDSMALLACALRELPGRFTVVHVRHGLRVAGERDAAFVRAVCARLGLPFALLEAAPGPASPGRSETAARRRRLAALAEAARGLDARWILLAHHLDDDLETLVLRLRRGHREDRALAGIPALRPLAGDVLLLRPFLAGGRPPGRAQLTALREAAGLDHVEDESNADAAIPRNAVRRWLAREPAGTREALLHLRHAARLRLQRAAGALAVHLHAEGLGARLDAEALRAPADDAPEAWRAELLRLLAAALQRPRRLDPRTTVLRQLDERLARGGAVSLPAEPSPLAALARHGALHFPDEPLAEPDGAARALAALLRLPRPL